MLVGVIGHVDHGKTALVKALTGKDTDRLPEENRRGISIELGFALLALPEGEIDIVDMPGHERFVRTMVAGATGMQAVLLVVAANEGVRRQTLEHLDIARLIGIRRGVVAVTKCDLADEARLQEVEADVRRALQERGLPSMPVVRSSAASGDGIDALERALAGLLVGAAPVDDRGLFQLPIDRVFAVAGAGAVATGTLRRGVLRVGDEVEVLPIGRRARVRGLQSHGRSIAEAPPGRRVAVNLRGIELAHLRRGFSLAPAGALQPSVLLDARVTLLPDAERPLGNGAAAGLLIGTSETTARLRLLDGAARAGETTFAQLRLSEPVACPGGEPFILRSASPMRTIGGGCVLDPAASRWRRADAAVAVRLRQLAGGDPARMLAGELGRAAGGGCAIGAAVRLLGRGAARVRALAQEIGAVVVDDEWLVDRTAFDRLCERMRERLRVFHDQHHLQPGLSAEQLQQLLGPAGAPPILAAALRHLLAKRLLVRERGVIRRSDFAPAQALTAAEKSAAQAVASAFQAGGLTPPDIAQVVRGDRQREQSLRYLVRAGVLVRTVDRVQQREVIFHAAAIEQAKRMLRQTFSAADGFLVREAGAALGMSRKYAIPLLEHLDAVRFTRRAGDKRYLVAEAASRDARDREPQVAHAG